MLAYGSHPDCFLLRCEQRWSGELLLVPAALAKIMRLLAPPIGAKESSRGRSPRNGANLSKQSRVAAAEA